MPIVSLLTRFSFAVIIAAREIIIRTNQNVAPLPLCAAIVYVIKRSAAVKCMAVYELQTGWNKHAFKRSTSIKRVHIDLRYAVGNCLPRKRSAIIKSTYSFE